MSALCLAGFGTLFCLSYLAKKLHLKPWVNRGIIGVGLGVLLTLTAGVVIIDHQGDSQWDKAETADYAVVLGAQIWQSEPSPTLQRRLDVALELMDENPEILVVVSGGKGTDELDAEAVVMARYLLENGGDESRILVEDCATNTRENLEFSAEIVEKLGVDTFAPVVISSDFHLARAKYIAGQLGMTPSVLASETHPKILKLNLLIRECFAFVKAVVCS